MTSSNVKYGNLNHIDECVITACNNLPLSRQRSLGETENEEERQFNLLTPWISNSGKWKRYAITKGQGHPVDSATMATNDANYSGKSYGKGQGHPVVVGIGSGATQLFQARPRHIILPLGILTKESKELSHRR